MANSNTITIRIDADGTAKIVSGFGQVEKSAEQMGKGVSRSASSAAKEMESFRLSISATEKSLLSTAGSTATFAAMGLAIKAGVDAANQMERASVGLAVTSRFAGESMSATTQAAKELTRDGLMPVTEASQALQNLLSRGFSLKEAVEIMNRLKDSAAYNRQAHLQFGQAIVGATEGLKNENSVLVDNAGVTKNVSVMWKEYALQHGKSVDGLTQAEKRHAEYNGILRETEGQIGNAARMTSTFQGAQAKLNKELFEAKAVLGQALIPALGDVMKALSPVIGGFRDFIGGVAMSGAAVGALVDKATAVYNKGGLVGLMISSDKRADLKREFAVIDQALDEQKQEIYNKYSANALPDIGADSGKRRQDLVLADEKAKKAAEKARKDQEAISQVLAGMRDRDLMIGKEKDEKELIQLEQKHRQELKQLREHHANATQLAEAARLQADEKADLAAQQRLEKARAMAMAEVQITEKKIEEQAAWQQKLDDYQVKTGGMDEETAIARRYERERQILSAKQNTLAVQIEQEKSDAKRLEMEEQYWALQRQIENSAVIEVQEKGTAAANLYAAYADINIQLKEMVGNLEDAARARQKLFWDSAQGQALINDAMAGKPGAADAYLAQENMDRLGLQQARVQDPINGPGGLRNALATGQMDPYAQQKERLKQTYEEQLRLADSYYATKVGKEQEHAALVENIQRDHATKMKKVEVDRWSAAAGTVAGYMGQMANELMQGNKKQFEIGKRMAQATAAIQGALAIVQAYGQLGPIAGTVAAVVIGAVTLQQIAKIDSQQYQATRAMGGSVEAGRSYLVGEHGPEPFVPREDGTIYPAGSMGGRGRQMQVTQVFQVSTGVSDTVRAEMMRMAPMFQQMAVSSVMQAMRNGEFQDVRAA